MSYGKSMPAYVTHNPDIILYIPDFALYTLIPVSYTHLHDKKYRALKFRTTWAIVLSVPVMVIGMFFMDMPYANLVMWLFSTPCLVYTSRCV